MKSLEGLVLSRHRDESVVIDLRKHGLGLAKVLVVETRPDKVRLLFGFDKSIPVNRLEVFEAREKSK